MIVENYTKVSTSKKYLRQIIRHIFFVDYFLKKKVVSTTYVTEGIREKV